MTRIQEKEGFMRTPPDRYGQVLPSLSQEQYVRNGRFHANFTLLGRGADPQSGSSFCLHLAPSLKRCNEGVPPMGLQLLKSERVLLTL